MRPSRAQLPAHRVATVVLEQRLIGVSAVAAALWAYASFSAPSLPLIAPAVVVVDRRRRRHLGSAAARWNAVMQAAMFVAPAASRTPFAAAATPRPAAPPAWAAPRAWRRGGRRRRRGASLARAVRVHPLGHALFVFCGGRGRVPSSRPRGPRRRDFSAPPKAFIRSLIVAVRSSSAVGGVAAGEFWKAFIRSFKRDGGRATATDSSARRHPRAPASVRRSSIWLVLVGGLESSVRKLPVGSDADDCDELRACASCVAGVPWRASTCALRPRGGGGGLTLLRAENRRASRACAAATALASRSASQAGGGRAFWTRWAEEAARRRTPSGRRASRRRSPMLPRALPSPRR